MHQRGGQARVRPLQLRRRESGGQLPLRDGVADHAAPPLAPHAPDGRERPHDLRPGAEHDPGPRQVPATQRCQQSPRVFREIPRHVAAQLAARQVFEREGEPVAQSHAQLEGGGQLTGAGAEFVIDQRARGGGQAIAARPGAVAPVRILVVELVPFV